ncbi:hypothetical protein E4T56_gene11710 [Termitomyces sp. T112]|nr:hypothetical protein E4T56_gene11710 [Termitomyces sp. T112]
MLSLVTTIPALLEDRSRSSAGVIHFLDDHGKITSTLTFSQLFSAAQNVAKALISFGLKGGGRDIVVTNFANQKDHILLFWGCCFAGIPICPLPPLHPDESRRLLFLEHLQKLFHGPTFISDLSTLKAITELSPTSRTINVEILLGVSDPSVDLSQIYPRRQASPSEAVALMLTSGSTGHSKGVVLTNSNILSAIKGKALKHETRHSDVFLNWINFDHVANVTEIHLHAIWSGASQYQVSPSAIIANPQSLLEWCSDYHVTHTFSPNFLLAQICRDTSTSSLSSRNLTRARDHALDLSSLRVFVTGGEANPVNTAVMFSDIIQALGAPRTALRAAFGMTETGAGSIYNARPIFPAVSEYGDTVYLPVGTPCVGTKLRIMDPSTLLPCPPNVPGQLQVTGTSVFEQYYANPRATEQSFTSDGWFITGDFAVLDENGDLHMRGRDKHDINVNGVKHPGADVELYLEDSNIPGLQPSFVFVSAMRLEGADTETYIVFYQHAAVNVDAISRNGLSESELRDVLSTNGQIQHQCSIFLSRAPYVVLPLPAQAFVKTALGKVSRPLLVEGYLQGKFAYIEKYLSTAASFQVVNGHNRPRSCVDEILCKWISEAFSINGNAIKISQNVLDLGASSMHLIRFQQFIKEHFGITDLPTIEMIKRPIIADLSSYIQKLCNDTEIHSQVKDAYNPLVCLNPHGSKPPLYLIHPGVGEVLIFINIARVLDDNRPVYALRARGFEAGETPPTSMQEMIEIYTAAIQKNNSTGPYFLAGYSFGGAIAFEIGKELEKQGLVVAWLGILNLPPYIQFRVKELVWVETMLNLFMFLSLVKSEEFESLKQKLLLAVPEAGSDSEPVNSLYIIEWILARSDQSRLTELGMPIEYFHRWINVAYEVSRTGRTYVPSGAVTGALTSVFCAVPLPSMGTREEYKHNRLSQWEGYSGQHFEMIDVDGEHYTMLSEVHVGSFALKMKNAIHRAEDIIAPPASKQNFQAIPIIDFSLFESDQKLYFQQLRYALEDVGFGIFVNVPGFEHAFQTSVFDIVKEFFDKSQQWKASLSVEHSTSLRGYFRADTVQGPHKAFAEAYRFGAERPGYPEGTTVPFWLRIHEGPNQWPNKHDMQEFQPRIEELFEKYHRLNLQLNKHIAHLLGIPITLLDDFYPPQVEFNAAVWHYFPLTPEMKANSRDGFVNGMHEHRDPSTFVTCLIQSRPGLQVQNHTGDWIDIPMVEGGVVCNIGMQLMSLTGGKLVATTHRVNSMLINEDRYTIPYVLTTKLDKTVTPLPQFASPAMAKVHVPPNAKVRNLMLVEDPCVRSGYARLSLFPAAAERMYPFEWKEAQALGLV